MSIPPVAENVIETGFGKQYICMEFDEARRFEPVGMALRDPFRFTVLL